MRDLVLGLIFVSKGLAKKERSSLDLSSWEVAFVGAEPINAVTLKRFADYFAPCGLRREAFYPCYGLAESTLKVTGSKQFAGAQIRPFDRTPLERNDINAETGGDGLLQVIVGCGSSIPGQEVRIVEPETLTLCKLARSARYG